MRRLLLIVMALLLVPQFMWAQNMQVERYGHTLIDVGTETYAIGGYTDGPGPTDDPAMSWEVLSAGSWTLYDFPSDPLLDGYGLYLSKGFLVGDEIFIVTQSGVAVKINTLTNQMTVLGQSTQSHNNGVFLFDETNNLISAIAGFQTLSVEFLDCSTGTWSSGPDFLGDYNLTNSAGVVRQSGEIVIGGGRRTNFSTWEVEIQDEIFTLPFGGQWSQTHTLLQARENHTAVLLDNGDIVWTGGNDLIFPESEKISIPPEGHRPPPDPPQILRLSTSEVTTVGRNQYFLEQVLQQPRNFHQSVVEGGMIVVALGVIDLPPDGDGWATIVEILDPNLVNRGVDPTLRGLELEKWAREQRSSAQTYHSMVIPVGETQVCFVEGALGTVGGIDVNGVPRGEKQRFTRDVPAIGPIGLGFLLVILGGLIIRRR